jgi:hypothetical protein
MPNFRTVPPLDVVSVFASSNLTIACTKIAIDCEESDSLPIARFRFQRQRRLLPIPSTPDENVVVLGRSSEFAARRKWRCEASSAIVFCANEYMELALILIICWTIIKGHVRSGSEVIRLRPEVSRICARAQSSPRV